MTKKTYMLLTQEERLYLKRHRGSVLTGQPAHFVIAGDHSSATYYWPWGRQPSPDLLVRIASNDPIRAANRFLALFVANSHANPPTRVRK